jgi:hypothetical protein
MPPRPQGQLEKMDAAAKKLFNARAANRPALLKAAQDEASAMTLGCAGPGSPGGGG